MEGPSDRWFELVFPVFSEQLRMINIEKKTEFNEKRKELEIMEEKRNRMRLWEKIIIIIAIIALPAVAIHEFISYPYFKSELGNMACEMVSEQAEIIAVEDGIGFVFYVVHSDRTTKLVAFQKNFILSKYKTPEILDANETKQKVFDDGIRHYLVMFNDEHVEIYSREWHPGNPLSTFFLCIIGAIITIVKELWQRYVRNKKPLPAENT